MERMLNRLLSGGLGIGILLGAGSALALPPAEDIPEEILRTEIITGARSPIDGRPLTATEYAEIQQQLQALPPELQAQVPDNFKDLITLLKLRRLIKTIFPFIPIR